MEELLTTGQLVFPLAYASQVQKIKAGKLRWPTIADMLIQLSARVSGLQARVQNSPYDSAAQTRFLEQLYKS